MKKTKLAVLCTVLAFSISSVFISPAFAKDKSNADLQKEIEVLQKRVEQLEAEKQQLQNTGKVWNPFEEIYKMQEEMDQMFQRSLKVRGDLNKGLFSNNMSYDANFEIKDQKDKYIIELDMKGLNENKTNIEIKDNYITIKGERSEENKKEDLDKGSYMASKSFSSFMRTIPLPADADTENVKSEQKGDKVIITLPKKK